VADIVEVFVEIPTGSRNKYEWDHHRGRFVLDRMLFSAVHYPGDYGFIRDCWGGDGDPLDAVVILGEPTFPGCTIHTRVVGMLRMHDDKGEDAKILGVPDTDPRWAHVQELGDIPKHLLDEVEHFFSIYKDLEHKTVTLDGWGTREEAVREVADGFARFATLDPKPVMP
jgi:inorganic pyrophosphatase